MGLETGMLGYLGVMNKLFRAHGLQDASPIEASRAEILATSAANRSLDEPSTPEPVGSEYDSRGR